MQQEKRHQNNTVTVMGIVVPRQWDEQFHVTEVLIACKDEREILVENFESLPSLLSLSRAEAVFTGVVRKERGVESMVVESFAPVENNIPG